MWQKSKQACMEINFILNFYSNSQNVGEFSDLKRIVCISCKTKDICENLLKEILAGKHDLKNLPEIIGF